MHKLRLAAETLTVESFVPSQELVHGGTVHAHSNDDSLIPCPGHTAQGASCADVTCADTCGQPASCGFDPCGTYWPGCKGYISFYPDPCVPIV